MDQAAGVGPAVVLSVVLSFRNEEAVLPELLRRLTSTLSPLGLEYELVFVNDASDDGSLRLLAEEAARNPRVKVITMSRVFGLFECSLAGFAFSRGAAVVLMDADLQDPPEVIPTLLDRWRKGADVVHTVRTARHGEPALKTFLTRVAYRLLRAVANIDLPVDAGDYKLMSRRVVDEVLKLPERSPYPRGLVAWVGFTQVTVPYERQPRFAGRTHSSMLFTLNPWRTFMSGLTSFSSTPMVVLLPFGLLVFVAAIAAAAAILIVPAWRGAVPLAGLIVLGFAALCGLQLAGLGMIGAYIGRIQDDVRGRPRYIVDTTIGVDGRPRG
jgi:dolichol-phosphate mannosyltransferase